MAEVEQMELEVVEEAAIQPMEAPTDPSDRLIWLAIQGNADVDKLEKLIELKNREEERANKKEFDLHFAEMQAEFAPVARSKQGDKSKYAPIEALQKQYGTSISKHHFSYRWSEESLPDGGLRVILTISGYGHSESNHKDLPVYEPDKGSSSGKPIMNAMQAEGVRSTYGRRYTFKDGFGISEEDEDTDGSFDDGVTYAEYIRKLNEETDPSKMVAIGREMYRELKKEGDYKGAEIIAKASTKRKELLLGGKK